MADSVEQTKSEISPVNGSASQPTETLWEPVDRFRSTGLSLFEKSGAEALNPVFASWIPARLSELNGTPGVNAFGQPTIAIEGVELTRVKPTLLLEANLRYEHARVPNIEKFLFSMQGENVIPAHEIETIALQGVSGFSQDERGRTVAKFHCSQPLQCVDASFFCIADNTWDQDDIVMNFAQPLRRISGQAVMPMLGSFYLNGEPLPESAQDKLNFRIVSLPPREDGVLPHAKFPVFVQGGRSLLIPGNFLLPVLPTPEGGSEIPQKGSPALKRLISGDNTESRQDNFQILRGIAVQYIGVGCERYVYHVRAKQADGKVLDLSPNEVIIKAKEDFDTEGHDVEVVQNTDYAGKRGIFLDQRHQYWADAATGSLATAKISIERDALLLRRGAIMSGVTFAMSTLIERSRLNEAMGAETAMVPESTAIAVKIILDDTLRLNVFTNRESSTPRQISQGLLRYLNCSEEEFIAHGRMKYLTELAGTLGHNAKVCLGCDFTLPIEQKTAENLSVRGGLTDSENFFIRRNRLEALPIIKGWIGDLHEVAATAGLSDREFVLSPVLGAFCQKHLSAKGATTALAQIRLGANMEFDRTVVGTIIAAEWVKESMQRDQVQYSPTALVKLALKIPQMLTATGFESSAARKELARLADGKISSIAIVKNGKFGSLVSQMNIAQVAQLILPNYLLVNLVDYQPTVSGKTNNPKPLFPLLAEEPLGTRSRPKHEKKDERKKRK